MFSISRPLVSSKLWRLPTRGALGNGLRVVAGAVLASGGWLTVETRGRRLQLRPQDTGDTLAAFEPCSRTTGTRVEIQLGEGLDGSDFDDRLAGDNLANTIYGAADADTLLGAGGNDMLIGQNGNDQILGGDGLDWLGGDDGDGQRCHPSQDTGS